MFYTTWYCTCTLLYGGKVDSIIAALACDQQPTTSNGH